MYTNKAFKDLPESGEIHEFIDGIFTSFDEENFDSGTTPEITKTVSNDELISVYLKTINEGEWDNLVSITRNTSMNINFYKSITVNDKIELPLNFLCTENFVRMFPIDYGVGRIIGKTIAKNLNSFQFGLEREIFESFVSFILANSFEEMTRFYVTYTVTDDEHNTNYPSTKLILKIDEGFDGIRFIYIKGSNKIIMRTYKKRLGGRKSVYDKIASLSNQLLEDIRKGDIPSEFL